MITMPVSTWSQFKTLVADKKLRPQYSELTNTWDIYAEESQVFIWQIALVKGSADATDFVDNHKDNYNKPIPEHRPFADADGFRTRFKGISGTATKNTTTDIDYLVTEERFINGVRLITSNHVDGDKVDLQVVDVDNILGGGAGTVLDMFGESWWIDSNICTQPDVVVPYPARIIAGLYIRIKYHSVGLISDVNVKANFYLHKKTS